MNFPKASGDLNRASGFGEKAAIQLQRETRTDDLDLLPLSERKRKLIYHDMPSNGQSVKQVIPDFGKVYFEAETNNSIPEFSKEWPGLPKGVKFDPSDEELLWHLLAEIGKGPAKRHPFINEFIVSIDEDDGLGNVHPQFLPGVKQDGSMSYFFHRKVEMYSSRKLKRQKNHNNSIETCWHSIGKLNLVCTDGIHQGYKEILTLYMNPVNGGNPVKTPWFMHRYHIGINGEEEDLVVSKFFYEMQSKQDTQDSQTDSVDGFVAEVVGVAAPLQVAPKFHERLHVESVSVDASTQVFSTLTPAELTTVELSQKDGFLANLGDSGISINNSNYDELIGDDTCDSNDAHIPMEMSCPERAPEHVLQTIVVDKIKTQGKFIANRFGEINTTGICSAGRVSREKHEAYFKCLDEAHVPLNRISSAEHSIAHENTIDGLVILGLATYSLKCEPSEETEPKIALEKNSNNWVNKSTQSAFPIKIEPKSFEDNEIDIAREKFSNNGLNASALSSLLIKVKTEPFEEAEASIILEKYVEKLPSFSQLSFPVNNSNSVNFCFSTANTEEKNIPHFHSSKEGTPSCNLSHQAYFSKNLTKISGLDELFSETNGLINQHQEKDGNVYDGLLMSNENLQVTGDNKCYPQINVHAGEPHSDLFSSSGSLTVKSEPVESSIPTYSQIPPCNTREHTSLMFENKRELYSDSPLDILDHIPLKYRLGISVSEGDATVKSGNISLEISQVTPGCRSFGYANTQECFSFSRRKRKKTATDSVEKAMEEDAPGLLKVLLDRGILVEEIKLYGDLEDNDPLETSSSEGSFEELETVMTKLFSERSSLLRFTSGRPVKGSRAVYCLAGLISLIEQTRYLRFRQTPIDWGWCRDLQSFIFIFQTHNRIVLERPEYGYATYFFELVDSLPINWQVKRLVKAMKLTNCSRTFLLENKPLIVGEDLSEGEAGVLEAYGWTRNTGFGTLLNYCDRVVHDRRNVMYGSEWRTKIGKMLMSGYDGGRMVLTNIPEKVVEYLDSQSSEIKMEI